MRARSWLSQGSHAQPLEARLPVSGTYPHGSPAHVVGTPTRSIVASYYNSATLNIVLLVSLSRVLSHTLCSLSLTHSCGIGLLYQKTSTSHGSPWFPTLPPHFFWVRPESKTFGRLTQERKKIQIEPVNTRQACRIPYR